ncbi:FERM, RhoGEF and pleckstrin domain-containing protein 1 [Sinocyclocheilus grahami]|uniref:FERM, RhoGEF and pleckstrin domain-containing protein 1 n=1 Tax=Sinocyclocheilus grahami TaxID=75366 RepID=UPI0007AD55FC|nr:PREDICTED: FERM, RhoGEF and pleckstrin domain-containing protein 1-like [Sinocyclocheilus grahami]
MVEPEERPSVAGQRLGAPESMGISTLEPGQQPPTMPPGRQVSIRVQMLDDTQEVFEVSQRASGKVLFDLVCAHLNLIEGDYFSLEYQDQRKMTVWLDLLKPILKQIRRPKNTILRFVVKFFPPDHTQLLEELTRYLFALQIKHDLACGRLTCNESSAALLVSHIVQSDASAEIPKHSKIQYNSSLSPSPPRLCAEGQGERNADSPIGHTQVTVENPALQRYTESLTSQTNGCRNGTPDEADTRLKPSPSKQQAEHLSTGPVSRSPQHSESLSAGQVMVNGQKQSLNLGQSPDGRHPSPLTSPLLTDAGFIRTDDEDEVRRKRFPTDKAYFIAKELLTTERTYLKDLEVITVSFQKSVEKDEAMPDSLRNLIFASFEPVYKFHETFLKDVEQRLAQWEGRSNAHIKGDYQRIGDVMLKNIQGLKLLTAHLQKHSEALLELERMCRSSRKLEGLCRDFELQKVCYLPLNIFFLRPLHRLMHYKQILERLCKHYPPTHDDFRDSRAALADVSEMVVQLHGTLIKMENFQKLLELKKDLIGIDNLALPGREFIRLGCLSKLSGKGLQQRMFFLFNDVLMYTSRGMTASNQFKVHGQLPLYGMTIRESEDEWGVPHSFTLFGQRQSVVVAASSASEMEKWVEDIKMAIELADKCNGPSAEILSSSFTDSKSPEESSADQESDDDLSTSQTSLERQTPHRGNTTVHVCWHRNTSVSMVDFSVALENQLSGNLLRKFKNSNGWQKLWVVFTNFSLFFYKTHQDEYPLASLPLLGYSITIPSESENIHKDYVFKLHFKSHVYYFRSESEYTFERWMEVIRSATCSSSHIRSLSRKEPHVY